jgi:hypothetical protein
MRQWKSLLVAPSCFPHPREEQEQQQQEEEETPEYESAKPSADQAAAVVRVVGCDGQVRSYRPPVTAREVAQAHPRHLVCRADALLIGERIPAVVAAEELQPGQAYFLLPAHLFRSALSFVSLASSLILLLSSPEGAGKPPRHRPFELCRTAAGTLQIKFSDEFLVVAGAEGEMEEARVMRGDRRLEKEYEGLVGYRKSRRWAPKLEPIQEVVVATATLTEAGPSSPPTSSSSSAERRNKSRGLSAAAAATPPRPQQHRCRRRAPASQRA